ncbi:phosphate transporter [Gonapodya prolifera JEL478]|uniref:Phosphate transporter n=1 Tax=Gonapodya prolifera (strain JEL478) TaxID=1344416 RepID=A0A139ARS8_GONPJ|nr:phosphate transporter [Gonapodya prolifera JEL478]|eukprot:KXS19448.1 phosphate transporter [Gonapodya prolifera JEL478]
MPSATLPPCPDGFPRSSSMAPHDYTWLFVVGLIQAFVDAYGIGANDVANSFATAVASKTISLRTACIIATFAEFLGAVLLGRSTSETIRYGILQADLFGQQPEILMLGMWCALIGSSTWVLIATYNGFPVSTTHSIVGGIVGMGIAVFGVRSVAWGWNGVSKIVASWFISPAAAGLLASVIYLVIKYVVMSARNPFEMGLKTLPVFFFITIGINLFYILLKGAGNMTDPVDMPTAQKIGFFGGILLATLLCSLFSYFFYAPWLKRVLYEEEDLKIWQIPLTPFLGRQPPRKKSLTPWGEERMRAERAAAFVNMEDKPEESHGTTLYSPTDVWDAMARRRTVLGKAAAVFVHGTEVDVANHEAEKYRGLQEEAVKYDSRAEELYSFLQVFTCTFASFAHGSNDVANAIGPLALIYAVWSEGRCFSLRTVNVNVAPWMLAFGGVAIDIGLLTYGYNVMRALGNHITYHSPSRGFSMELGTSLTVLTASYLGIPVSTTHCITGATAGVGLCNGKLTALNWKLLAWCLFSWLVTLPIAGGIAGLLMASYVNAPVRVQV